MKTLGRQMLCYLLLCFAVTTYAEETISIDTDNTSLIYKVDKDKKLRQVYFGSFLDAKEAEATQVTKADAYPTFGTSYVNEAALRANAGWNAHPISIQDFSPLSIIESRPCSSPLPTHHRIE